MSLTKALSIGRSGLMAAQHGTNVTAQNITNAATEGYTRRSVNLQSVQMDHGGGVAVAPSTRVHDEFLEKRSLGARASSGEAEGRVATLNILDSVLADDPGDLGSAMDSFETAVSDFAAQPNEPGTRQALLASTQQVSQAFNRTAEGLNDARVAANERIVNSVDQVNSQLAEIGSLTRDINIARNSPSGDAGDLMDQRDRLVREVGKAVPVTTLEDDKGNFSLRLNGGLSLVDVEGGVHALQANVEAGTGDVRIYRDISGRTEDITKLITSGSIGGTMTARDGALKNAQTALDRLAFDMAQTYNTVHQAGVGLDGEAGRDLFSVSVTSGVTGAANSIKLSSDVAGSPDHLAAAENVASLPGDNRNALKLLDIREQKLTNGGVDTAQSAFSSIVAGAGSALRSAMDRQTQTDATVSQMDALRESVSGVSTDDEMISLMRYQRAYQASLRVIETADQMMQELLNLGR
jgi:flagellar hook-associated protein 1 FlgK